MLRSKRRLTAILIALLIAFSLVALYLCYFELFRANGLKNNENNMRNWVDESMVARGRFLDRTGHEITSREKNSEGKWIYYCNHPNMYSQIIGYNSDVYGKSGLQAKYNNVLLNLDTDNPIAYLRNQVLDAGTGNDIRLTIDNQLQYTAYTALDGRRGSVVAMDPQTGKILAMVSVPSFNLNTVDDDWNKLIDNENSPLLNRATQGLYTPGSVMKPISAMAFLTSKIPLSYDDTGEYKLDGFTFTNFENASHGPIGLREALIYSSNTYFANKSQLVGGEAMKKNADLFYLDKEIPFDLPVSVSSNDYAANMKKTELAADAFGQGETLVTPLNMCVAYSAFANGGTILKPQIVDAFISPSGHVTEKARRVALESVGHPQDVEKIRDYLADVATETGTAADPGGFHVCGKTGTAENSSGKAHAWYCGFAPKDNPKICVVVILEEIGQTGGEAAAPVAGAVISDWLSR